MAASDQVRRPPPAALERRRRSAAIDGLRGIAALTVFVFHAWLYTLPRVDAGAAGGDSTTAMVLSQLRIGLVLFFVLSGFLLYRPWAAAGVGRRAAPRVRSYARHRIARILPAYYVALAGSIALLWSLGGEPGVRLPPTGQLPLFLVFAQNQSADTVLRLDPPMWTLAVEAAFYVLLPAAGWLALRAAGTRAAQLRVPLTLVAAGVLFNLVLEHAAGPSPQTLTKSLPAMLPYFGLGMATAVLVAERSPGARAAGGLLGAGALLALLDGVLHARVASGSGLAAVLRVVRDLPAAVGFAMIIAVAATHPPRLLGSRPLTALGTISYGFYLWHVPLLLALRAHGLMPVSVLGALLVGLPAATLAGLLSWRLVEAPMIARSRRADAQSGPPAGGAERVETNPSAAPAAQSSAATSKASG